MFEYQSLLSWERGLKYGKSVEKLFVYESLLSWERGLKSKTGFNRDICQEVAPLVGAWIEIWLLLSFIGVGIVSLLSWERGLK